MPKKRLSMRKIMDVLRYLEPNALDSGNFHSRITGMRGLVDGVDARESTGGRPRFRRASIRLTAALLAAAPKRTMSTCAASCGVPGSPRSVSGSYADVGTGPTARRG